MGLPKGIPTTRPSRRPTSSIVTHAAHSTISPSNQSAVSLQPLIDGMRLIVSPSWALDRSHPALLSKRGPPPLVSAFFPSFEPRRRCPSTHPVNLQPSPCPTLRPSLLNQPSPIKATPDLVHDTFLGPDVTPACSPFSVAQRPALSASRFLVCCYASEPRRSQPL